MTIRVAVNGFGRMGRSFLRIAIAGDLGLDVVAVNDLGPPEALARLFERDSVYGRFPGHVSVVGDLLVLDGRKLKVLAEPDLKALPWKDLQVDVVVEATGRYTTRAKAAGHLDAGAPRVVVSAPCADADATFVMGVNDETFDPGAHLVVSNASCTTNCLAPMAKVLDDALGIERGFMTTVHAYTGDQRLVDSLHKDPRRARAAALNIVPTTTGAARATGLVLPHLSGRLDGIALRVPVADGSVTDLVVEVGCTTSAEEVRGLFEAASVEGPLVGRLEYSQEPLVSTDVIGSSASCVFDAAMTMVSDSVVKVLGWYDNEWGYASRLVELVAKVGSAPHPT